MKLSGKKLTTAILAGLMGATVAGISVVGAANPVVLNGTTLEVSPTAGVIKPILRPVNVTKGIIDGTTTNGNIVKSGSTVGANLDALDAAVVGKADKAALDAKANKTDFDPLKEKVDKAKVDTALHVDKDGKLVVGTDKKVNRAVSVKSGFKDGTTEAGQGKIVSADNTVGQNLTALDTAVAANKKAADNALATKADKADLEKAKVDTALHVDKDGKLVVGTDKKVNKAVSVEKGFKDGTTAAGQGNIVSAGKTVGENLTALDNAVATNKNDIATNKDNIAANKKAIADEATARDQAVAQERAERKGADAAQDKVIQQVNKNVADGFNTINKNIGTITDQLNKNDLAEQQARADKDKEHDTAIAANKKAIADEATARDQAVAQERAERKGADAAQDKVIQQVNKNVADGFNTINKNIGTITDQLNKNDLAEQQARVAGDKAEEDARVAADQAEAKTRADKDKEHDTAIAANKKAIGDEAAARQADVSRLDNKIHDVSKEVDTVGALSMAMSGLHPLSYDEGDARFQLSAAVGTYDGTEALALGGFYHFNRDSMLSVGVATDLGADEHRMGANVGYTRRIGQGGHVSRPSEGTVSDIMKDIKNLEQKQAKLEQENEQLKQQLAALKK
ncbi:YadA-like family protein [uncultured Megasphaera sp.]|uniref:YadA-like family protein n=1 Tax=uncultured Megasphaera sp. TaxID=165188 RepID=UPI0025E5FC30|nr:YadA-like family protein [uncultured Megasphaera sp.]